MNNAHWRHFFEHHNEMQESIHHKYGRSWYRACWSRQSAAVDPRSGVPRGETCGTVSIAQVSKQFPIWHHKGKQERVSMCTSSGLSSESSSSITSHINSRDSRRHNNCRRCNHSLGLQIGNSQHTHSCLNWGSQKSSKQGIISFNILPCFYSFFLTFWPIKRTIRRLIKCLDKFLIIIAGIPRIKFRSLTMPRISIQQRQLAISNFWRRQLFLTPHLTIKTLTHSLISLFFFFCSLQEKERQREREKERARERDRARKTEREGTERERRERREREMRVCEQVKRRRADG